jgi:hypothetical protein
MTNTDKGRRLRFRRASRGLCVACGLVTPKLGRLRCEACIGDDVLRKARWRMERKEAGQ